MPRPWVERFFFMSRKPHPALLVCLTLLPMLAPPLAAPRRARACALAPRANESVVISGEEALIVWLPSEGKEHFIRTASFEGASADFGFLVPTPSRPTFTEAPERIFRRLFDIYKERRPARRSMAARSRTRSATGGAPTVRVVDQQQVAGLEATVLESNDAAALNTWLGEHAYPSNPELEGYFAPYIERGWLMNAFRYDPSAEARAPRVFASRAITLSFDTQRPYFPYAEPQSRGPRRGRPFRVSVLAPYRVAGRVGDAAYRGRVGYAAPLSRARLERLLRGTGVPRASLPDSMWLTVFDEPRSHRGTEGLYFVEAPDQSRVRARLSQRLGVRATRRRPPREPEAPVLNPWN